jgi:hypothetical protein
MAGDMIAGAALLGVMGIGGAVALHSLYELVARPGRRRASALRLAAAVVATPLAMAGIGATLMDAPATGVATVTPAVAQASPVASSDERDAAKEALELHYIQTGIYKPVRCREGEVSGRAMVFCVATGGDGTIGGLYAVEPGPRVFAVNGKAIQHIERAEGGVIKTAVQTEIPVARWSGDPIDIPAALEAMR